MATVGCKVTVFVTDIEICYLDKLFRLQKSDNILISFMEINLLKINIQ